MSVLYCVCIPSIQELRILLSKVMFLNFFNKKNLWGTVWLSNSQASHDAAASSAMHRIVFDIQKIETKIRILAITSLFFFSSYWRGIWTKYIDIY